MKPICTASLICLVGNIVTALSSNESTDPHDLPGSYLGLPGRDVVYDFVVVGAGTAGLTIASRLSQHPTVKVAVIEAGDFYEISNGNLSEVPAYTAYFTGNDPVQKNPLVDWYQYTEPQPVSTLSLTSYTQRCYLKSTLRP